MSRRLLVTNALPYANGPLHMGHLLGYIQADIWVRAQRMSGNKVVYVCADDAHGTPIMLAAEKAGMTPEAFIAGIREGHEADFAAFGVAFDQYHTTHSEENRELATLIYTRLRDAGYIARRSIQQLFDPEKQMFLPDRYIKGVCPNCGTPDQYGDNCEHCGATYAPTDLINPYSVMSGATPVLRDSEHYFFELGKFESLLRDWFAGKLTHGKPVANSGVAAKLREWLDGGLKDWDISRDAPYFGFPIPDAPGKFFYVWLDAPVGYLASFKALCDRNGVRFDDFLGALASRKRKAIKRERRDALAAGLTIEWVTGSDLSEAHWDAFYRFYVDTGSRKWGRPYLNRRFFSLIGERMPERILLVMAKREGQYVAGAINLIGDRALYGRNWGCIEDHPFLHFEVCYYQAIDFAIARGLARVEAGAQGEHKLARGYRPVITHSAHDIADPSLRRAIADYLAREARHVEAAAEALDEATPFRKGDD